MCSVCGGRRAAGASPIRCVGERITATGVPEFREVAWRACPKESRKNKMGLAQTALRKFARLYALEKQIKDLTIEQRYLQRQ
ncbi:hypothetical protein [Bathymodiolus japonicus methanotrophic gill symbiont]|uniref:hypothetical protein n=1 Tax=Bathymodiolus japonicus methanotrophic gill symbiont TaxID=113269 RepID=UPI001C8DA7F1|nr:hypothetical protein [Bathymodiolus japonicus methanotrophic gill symbiont]